MKKQWFGFVLVAVVALLVIPALSCQQAEQAADDAAEKVGEGAEAVGEAAEDAAEKTGEMVEEGAEAVKETAGEMMEEGKEMVDDAAEAVKEEVEKAPEKTEGGGH
jgi:gas vesicle protein